MALLPVVLMHTAVLAQGGSDIYLAHLRSEGGRLSVGAVTNITARAGYDNQPSFTPAGRAILFTSIREDAQADTYRYDLASRAVSRVTSSQVESEYSPTVMPGGRAFSAVRVEADSTQRLWAFDLDGTHPRVLLEHVKPVGYHAWVDRNTVALFVLGNPATLQIADLSTGEATVVATSIGRSIHKVPGRNAVSFLHQEGDSAWIEEVDVATHAVRQLVRPVEGNEFYAWTPDGTLLMGSGATLYRRRPGSAAWERIAELGVSRISRLAVSADGKWIAVVAADAAQ